MRRWSAALLVVLAACTSPDARTDRPGDGEPSPTAPTGESGARTVDDTGPVGSAGPILLTPGGAAVVEVDRSPAANISVDPQAVIAAELREHAGKQSVRAAGASQVPGKPVYSAEELRTIAAASRSQASTSGEPAIYVLVLEGRFEDEDVTAVAFQATGFALFPDRLGGGVLGLNRGVFERALVVHELGHLFGLVDLTGQGEFHEDPEHRGHSANRDSVMYWAVENVSVVDVFSAGPPTEFDEADRQEMARIRAG